MTQTSDGSSERVDDLVPTRAMPCPICGAGTIVHGNGGRYVPEAGTWLRQRRCDGLPGGTRHVFETVERPHAHQSLAAVEVTTPRGTKAYSRDDLDRDLSWTLGYILSKEQRNEVARVVEARVAAALPRKKKRSETQGVESTAITEAVAQALLFEGQARRNDQATGSVFRRAHVMWELARGRFAGPGDGFEQLVPLLDWLVKTYPLLRHIPRRNPPSRPHYSEPRSDRWHPLRNDAAPHPSHVIHRHTTQRTVAYETQIVEADRILDANGTYVRGEHSTRSRTEEWVRKGADDDEYVATRFEFERFQLSVKRTFHGRTQSDHRARYVVQWVLWALAGQDVVREADLSALTTQCIRRVDAIAYLRWAVVTKHLTVEGLWHEVHGMLDWPASRLEFPAQAAADQRVSDQIQPDIGDQLRRFDDEEPDT